jgi:quercetin dioxygenase-like cupin family protein
MNLTLTAPGGALTRRRGRRGARPKPQGFVVSHAKGARFEQGLRGYFGYRDLGIRAATGGRVVAHVIKAATPLHKSVPHYHLTEFQLVYVLKGWIEFDYEGVGTVRLEAGSCVHQPPGIRHAELGHSDDLELLEVVMPADFETVEVEAAGRPAKAAPTKPRRKSARRAKA